MKRACTSGVMLDRELPAAVYAHSFINQKKNAAARSKEHGRRTANYAAKDAQSARARGPDRAGSVDATWAAVPCSCMCECHHGGGGAGVGAATWPLDLDRAGPSSRCVCSAGELQSVVLDRVSSPLRSEHESTELDSSGLFPKGGSRRRDPRPPPPGGAS